jgi:hypothetical protein
VLPLLRRLVFLIRQFVFGLLIIQPKEEEEGNTLNVVTKDK